MSNLFNEIDEDLRQEKLKSLWARYRNAIFAAIIIIAIILISSESYKYWTKSKIEKSGIIFSQLIENIEGNNIEGAETDIKALMLNGTNEYQNYAMILNADILVGQNQLNTAEDAYEDIIENSRGLLKEIAQLKLAYLKIDTSSYAEINDLLSNLLLEESLLYLFATEALAISAYKEDSYDLGIKHAQKIIDSKRTTTGMYDRANMMLKVFNSKK
jgi:hypothetical protein